MKWLYKKREGGKKKNKVEEEDPVDLGVIRQSDNASKSH